MGSPIRLTAMSYIQQSLPPSRPYAPRESGGVIDGIPDEAIITPPTHFYLLRNVNNVTVIMADLAVHRTVYFVVMTYPCSVLAME